MFVSRTYCCSRFSSNITAYQYYYTIQWKNIIESDNNDIDGQCPMEKIAPGLQTSKNKEESILASWLYQFKWDEQRIEYWLKQA
jgi:hypothetical protein